MKILHLINDTYQTNNQNKIKMTPKEKAEELVDKFMPHSSGNSNNNEAKQCAIIAVDEIIDLLIWHTGASDLGNTLLIDDIKYYQEVKKEIENL